MAVKTIKIDMDAYRRLEKARRTGESVSDTLRRVIWDPAPFEAAVKRFGPAAGNGRGARGPYAVFLVIGALLALALLVRQLLDWAADGNVPALRQNDMYSAVGSVVMLAIIGYAFFGPARKASK